MVSNAAGVRQYVQLVGRGVIGVDAETGKVLWGPERNAGGNSAAITYADGRLYFRYQDGRMILVEATPEAYQEHGTFLIPNVEKKSWSHPVIANGRLLLKGQGTLHAYDIRAGAAPADS